MAHSNPKTMEQKLLVEEANNPKAHPCPDCVTHRKKKRKKEINKYNIAVKNLLGHPKETDGKIEINDENKKTLYILFVLVLIGIIADSLFLIILLTISYFLFKIALKISKSPKTIHIDT